MSKTTVRGKAFRTWETGRYFRAAGSVTLVWKWSYSIGVTHSF